MAERELPYRGAINEALRQEMRRDESVFVMGEDIAGAPGRDDPEMVDAWGGVLKVTEGLINEFGPERVRDTPITESAFIGAGVGAAATGMRPVGELMFIGFMGVTRDQIINQAAKMRYMSGGKAKIPLVIRTTIGAGFRAAAQHSDATYSTFVHFPGLKVVAPATPYDAKGLLIQSIRDNDPVIFCEHKALYTLEGDVPEEAYTIPFGEANITREGDDITIVTLGRMVHVATEAATALAKDGINCEIVDLRTTSPMDTDTIIESVENTGRLVVLDEANPRCSIATDVSAIVCQEAFDSLKAPVRMVTAPHVPVPFADNLEDTYIPDAAKVQQAVLSVMGKNG